MANTNVYSATVRNCVKNHVLIAYSSTLLGYTTVEPFYNGDDYTTVDYTNKVVVDEPPFNQIMAILNYYRTNGVYFFLYIPALCNVTELIRHGRALIDTGVPLTKQNDVTTFTSFITNLEPSNVKLKTYPYFREDLINANAYERALRQQKITGMRSELSNLMLYTSENYVTNEHTVNRS